MVVKISSGKNIVGLINYNENKVAKGQALLIGGENMMLGKTCDKLTYAMKVASFERLLENKKSYRLDKNTFHTSINFDPTEKPGNDLLINVADRYMNDMGYENQPYLVYRHTDTHHPHIHIISVKVDRDGKKIDDKFYKRRSEKVRKALEEEYNLVKAAKKPIEQLYSIEPIQPSVFEYGKAETKEAISKAVRCVMETYKVCNLKEMQIALSQFNIHAEKVNGKSKNENYEGLIFSVTDQSGQHMGPRIKSSAFSFKPTLKNLEATFLKNQAVKKTLLEKTSQTIAKVLADPTLLSREDFTSRLDKQGIKVIYHQGKKGIYGVSFIDHNCKAVFKGSELGKAFSWNYVAKRFEPAVTDDNKAKIHTKSDLPDQSIITRETMEAASSAVATVYHQLRKDPLKGDYFESAFIRKLDKIDLITPLLNYPMPLNLQQLTQVAEGFKAFKKAKLPQIEKKENAYFNKQVDVGLKFIEKMQQSDLKEKVFFLFRYNLSVTKKGDQLFITHTKGEHLNLQLKGDMRRVVMGESISLPLLDTSKLTPFTKKEKDIIAKIAAGKDNTENKKYQQIIKVETFQTIKANHTTTTLFDAANSHNHGEGVDSHHQLNKKKKRRQGIS